MGNEILRYRSFTGTANQWEYNSNCKTIQVFGVINTRE
jgi:hypothetical protein